MMDPARAFVFARVVEAQGFSAAGRILDMPKTTVSKKVAELEAELGVRLLVRTTRRVSTTQAGARVYARCQAAMRQMEAAEREARALQHAPEGMLTVAAPGAIGVPFLLPAIAAFMARHPGVQVTLLSADEPMDLERARVDVLLWAGVDRPAGHAVRLIAKVELGLFASAEYLARRGAPSSPDDLRGHDAVALLQALHGRRFAWELERAGRKVEVAAPVQPRFRSNDPLAAMSAVAAGFGISGLPTRLVAATPQGSTLVRVLPGWNAPPVQLSALYRDASSASVRLFLDFAADWFRRL